MILKLIVYSLILLPQPKGVIRHGIDKMLAVELATQEKYNCVGYFTQSGKLKGSCVAIGPNSLLTAAHTIQNKIDVTMPVMVILNNKTYLVDSLLIHPWYADHKGADLALLIVNQPITGIDFPQLSRSKKELGKKGTTVGYGNFSVANNPREITDAGKIKSGGENMLDSLVGSSLPNGELPFLFADFDHPDEVKFNKSGNPTALKMEFGLDGGDSGGGLFISKGNKIKLIGINAIQNKNIAEIIRTKSFYGSSSQWVRISVFRSWIKQALRNLN